MKEEKKHLKNWRGELEGVYKDGATPHCANLMHQCTDKSAAHKTSRQALEVIIPSYFSFINALSLFNPKCMQASSIRATAALEEYMKVVREEKNQVFKSQSDFLTSVIPEFFIRLFAILLDFRGIKNMSACGQRDIPIDMSFDPRSENLYVPRTQRVDIAIVRRASFVVDDREVDEFFIPIVAGEAKTYFDKNMISGMEYSAASMKKVFPHCSYFAIAELADFDLSALSYASGEIDEIYIIRKQKRAIFRKTNVPYPVDPKLIQEILESASSVIDSCSVRRTDLEARIASGKLIAE